MKCPACEMKMISKRQLKQHYESPLCDWWSSWNYETDRREDFCLLKKIIKASHSKTKIAHIDFGKVNKLRLQKSINSMVEIGCGRYGIGEGLGLAIVVSLPRMEVIGVDKDGRFLRGNKTLSMGVDNIRFLKNALPYLPQIRRQFDLVVCIRTLRYVQNIRFAIRRLWELVNPGGLLYFDYPDKGFRKDLINGHRLLKQIDLSVEEDEEQYKLVLQGHNLLTYTQIRSEIKKSHCLYSIACDGSLVIAVKMRQWTC